MKTIIIFRMTERLEKILKKITKIFENFKRELEKGITIDHVILSELSWNFTFVSELSEPIDTYRRLRNNKN